MQKISIERVFFVELNTFAFLNAKAAIGGGSKRPEEEAPDNYSN
jgi:hypothetical protein